MSRKRTTTSRRLTIALSLIHQEVNEMVVAGPSEGQAKGSALAITSALLDSPAFLQRLADKMDEVK